MIKTDDEIEEIHCQKLCKHYENVIRYHREEQKVAAITHRIIYGVMLVMLIISVYLINTNGNCTP